MSTLNKLSGEIKIIPLDFFRDLNLAEIILLTSDPSKIKKRLEKRDNKVYNLELLEEFQEYEVKQATKVAKELNIKITRIEA